VNDDSDDDLDHVGSPDPLTVSEAPNGQPWCLWCEDTPAQGTLEVIDPDTGLPCGRPDVLIHVCEYCGKRIHARVIGKVREGVVFVFVRYGSHYGDEDEHTEWLSWS
jgi:hypothetical protein